MHSQHTSMQAAVLQHQPACFVLCTTLHFNPSSQTAAPLCTHPSCANTNTPCAAVVFSLSPSHPSFLHNHAAFFAWGCALIDYSGWPEFKRKMRVDFLPTLTAEISIWPVVQSVNFSVVPIKHQLLVINCFTIMDAAFMSWARNQEDWVTKVVAAFQGSSKGKSSSSTGALQMQPLAAAAGSKSGGGGKSSSSKGH